MDAIMLLTKALSFTHSHAVP